MNKLFLHIILTFIIVVTSSEINFAQYSSLSSTQSTSYVIAQGGDYTTNVVIGQSTPIGKNLGGEYELYAGYLPGFSNVFVDMNLSSNTRPIIYSLSQNYPNPFNPTTTIQYSIQKQSYVSLKIFDVLGREVSVVIDKEQPQGNYVVEFDSSNLTSGIYFYRILAGDLCRQKR